MTADNSPAIRLTGDVNAKWKIEISNFPELEKALGRDVVNVFCRCFVHSDRLTSTISCLHVSEQHHGRDSTAFGRNRLSMLWFTIGTLRELARAIKDARDALAKRKWLKPESEHWTTLRKIEDRWEKDKFFRKMRNVAAFHVDKELIDKGLDKLVEESVIDLAEGHGKKQSNSVLSLGALALFCGLEMDLDRWGEFVKIVSNDESVVAAAIQNAFICAAKAAGVCVRHY